MAAPSSEAIVVTPSTKPLYRPGRVCSRVFTTSSGVTVRWVSAHPKPPLAANSAYLRGDGYAVDNCAELRASELPPRNCAAAHVSAPSAGSRETGARASWPKAPSASSAAGGTYARAASSQTGRSTAAGGSASAAAASAARAASAASAAEAAAGGSFDELEGSAARIMSAGWRSAARSENISASCAGASACAPYAALSFRHSAAAPAASRRRTARGRTRATRRASRRRAELGLRARVAPAGGQRRELRPPQAEEEESNRSRKPRYMTNASGYAPRRARRRSRTAPWAATRGRRCVGRGRRRRRQSRRQRCRCRQLQRTARCSGRPRSEAQNCARRCWRRYAAASVGRRVQPLRRRAGRPARMPATT